MSWFYHTVETDGGFSTGIIPGLIDKTVHSVFRDGLQYFRVAGLPTGKEINFDIMRGEISFDTTTAPLLAGEVIAARLEDIDITGISIGAIPAPPPDPPPPPTFEGVIFTLNDYLTTDGTLPYPILSPLVDTITSSGLTNVMDYGAVGDGVAFDDDAIVAAFNAATVGVLFPAGVYLVRTLNAVTYNKNLIVWAYGATIKMGNLRRYSWLTLDSTVGAYTGSIIWLGGTIDGNESNQQYPGNPAHNGAFVEAHGSMLTVDSLEFALFKDVNVINTVVDGISMRSCELGVYANCTASNGAPLKYSEVAEQGTYFKFTRERMKTVYYMDITCDGGSIGAHSSYPTNATMDANTLTVITNSRFTNQAQNNIHIEDCYQFFIYNSIIEGDADPLYNTTIHMSNRTGIVSIKNCTFRNARLDFSNSRDLVMDIIDANSFESEWTAGDPDIMAMMIEGRPILCTNNSFTGRCAEQQAHLENTRGCTFTNFGALAILGGYATDDCDFVTGTRPVQTGRGGFVTSTCTFTSVTNPNAPSQPATDTWQDIFDSTITVVDQDSNLLGVIACDGALP